MTILQAIILAIIEGITEFLPVSSTGHMIIGSSVMGIASHPFVKVFTVAIQFGAILSVLVLYWRRFLQNFMNFTLNCLSPFARRLFFGLLFKNISTGCWKMLWWWHLPSLPAGFCFFFWTGILPAGADRKHPWMILACPKPCVHRHVPGGIHDTGCEPFGCNYHRRIDAGAFTHYGGRVFFFLAVPTMFAATCKSLWDYIDEEGGSFSGDELLLLAIGNVVAFIVAMIAIRSFIQFLTKKTVLKYSDITVS